MSLTPSNHSSLPPTAEPIIAVHEVQLRGGGFKWLGLWSLTEVLLANQLLTVDRKRQVTAQENLSATREGGSAARISHVTLLSSSQAVTSASWRWVMRPINVTFRRETQRQYNVFTEKSVYSKCVFINASYYVIVEPLTKASCLWHAVSKQSG